jgi:adenylyltransferase/sulfurtransferase
MRFREVAFRRAADCPLCGDAPSQAGLVEYSDSCLSPAEDAELEIEPVEVARRRAAGERLAILDVRLPHELRLAAIAGTIDIPLHELPERLDELPRDRPIVTLCHVGVRSLHAADLLREQGFAGARSLAGGIEAWSREVDPRIPRY